jgi:hypothetical protein
MTSSPVLEGMGFLGIEKDPESYQTAADRIRYWLSSLPREARTDE